MTKRHHRAKAVGAAQRPPQPESVVFLSPDNLMEVFGQNRSVGEDVVRRLPLPFKQEVKDAMKALQPDTKENLMQEDQSKSDTADAQPDQPVKQLKYSVQEPCRFCGKKINVFGLPRHESWCNKNPNAKKPGDESRPKEPVKIEHTDDDYTTCDLCNKRMLKNSVSWHKKANCPVKAFLAKQDGQPEGLVSIDSRSEFLQRVERFEEMERLSQLIEQEPTPESVPVSVTDEDLLELLEIVVPTIKPSTFGLVTEWIALTRKLAEANQ